MYVVINIKTVMFSTITNSSSTESLVTFLLYGSILAIMNLRNISVTLSVLSNALFVQVT